MKKEYFVAKLCMLFFIDSRQHRYKLVYEKLPDPVNCDELMKLHGDKYEDYFISLTYGQKYNYVKFPFDIKKSCNICKIFNVINDETELWVSDNFDFAAYNSRLKITGKPRRLLEMQQLMLKHDGMNILFNTPTRYVRQIQTTL